MKVAESMQKGRKQVYSRSVQASGMPKRYRHRYGLENEAVVILVLFMLLIVVLLYFS